MKTNGTHILLIRVILFILITLYSLIVFGQPDYDFRNPTLISGTDKQVNAVYRYNNVKSGVNANVTITALTNGITVNNIDSGSGFGEALQPVIDVPGRTSGYLEMKIDFLNTATGEPMQQSEVSLTPLDVDGESYSGNGIYEYDMIKLNNGYADFDMTDGELFMDFPEGWVTGTNMVAINCPGIDTTAKQVMFSVVNESVTSVIIRVGADNHTFSNKQRLRSIYFKKFSYKNAYFASSGNKTNQVGKSEGSLTPE